MKIKRIRLHQVNVILIFLAMGNLFAQAPDTLWTRTYGGTGDDVGSFVQQTTDGGYIILGTIGYQLGADGDIFLIKTDSNGDTLWTRTYGDSGRDLGECVQQTSDGGYILCGNTTSFGAGGADVYVIKTDAAGDTQWTKTFGGTGAEEAHDIRQTTDGGYIFVGNSSSCTG